MMEGRKEEGDEEEEEKDKPSPAALTTIQQINQPIPTATRKCCD